MLPGVTIGVLNGGLGLQAPTTFGDSVVLVASPVAPVAGYGVAFKVTSLAQTKTAFAQVGNEGVVTAFTNGFWAGAPTGTNLFILAMARTTPLATLLAAANANKALNIATDINGIPGTDRLLAAIKFPDLDSYTPTVTDGFDEDVISAVTAAQTLAGAWLTNNKPLRIFVEGFAFTDAADAEDYSTASNPNVFIITGNIDASTATATLLALGVAAGLPPQVNIARVKNGSLPIPATSVVNIGAILVDSMTTDDLTTLFNKRYITFIKNPIASGYLFNYDSALTQVTDDYNNLRYGRIVDNAVRIAYNTYFQEVNDNVDVDDNGRIGTVAEKALETDIETAIANGMPGQLNTLSDGTPDVSCLVNPDPTAYASLYTDNNIAVPNFNLLQTGSMYIFLLMRPQGCLEYINVYVGYQA